jgi:hypothetical protein
MFIFLAATFSFNILTCTDLVMSANCLTYNLIEQEALGGGYKLFYIKINFAYQIFMFNCLHLQGRLWYFGKQLTMLISANKMIVSFFSSVPHAI